MYNNGNSSKNVTGSSVVDGTLESADFADNGLSGDKIDGGVISNFQSTGIDDRLATGKAIYTNGTKVGVGTSIPSESLEVKLTSDTTIKIDSVNANTNRLLRFGAFSDQHNGNGYIGVAGAEADLRVVSYTGDVMFKAGNVERMRIASNGAIKGQAIYDLTTSNASNVYVNSAGQIYRSTSSLKYKENVETMEDSYADAVLNLRPVWFNSKSNLDTPGWGYWGLIAEEVAEIDPRLVFWKEEYETRVVDEETGETEEVAVAPDQPEAEGVQYDRIIPHLINIAQRQNTKITDLEARLTALEKA